MKRLKYVFAILFFGFSIAVSQLPLFTKNASAAVSVPLTGTARPATSGEIAQLGGYLVDGNSSIPGRGNVSDLTTTGWSINPNRDLSTGTHEVAVVEWDPLDLPACATSPQVNINTTIQRLGIEVTGAQDNLEWVHSLDRGTPSSPASPDLSNLVSRIVNDRSFKTLSGGGSNPYGEDVPSSTPEDYTITNSVSSISTNAFTRTDLQGNFFSLVYLDTVSPGPHNVSWFAKINSATVTYDDAGCVYDGAVKKTLLNPSSVHAGGTATYEITLTNNGTAPIAVSDLGGNGIYDIPAVGLSYQSVSSEDIPDIECQDAGSAQDLFGNDQSGAMPYHNHLQSHIVLCGSPSHSMIPVSESRSFRMVFAVNADALQVTNTISYIVNNDVDFSTLASTIGGLTLDGPDMIDLMLNGTLNINNASFSTYAIPSSSGVPSSLAYTGSRYAAAGTLGAACVVAFGIFVVRRRAINLR